jgi:very-short-patch-repair endonuclease
MAFGLRFCCEVAAVHARASKGTTPESNASRRNPVAGFTRWEAPKPVRCCFKGKSLEGVRFLRQKAFGRYIVDFYCASAKLVIELDGEVHDTVEAQTYDAVLTETLTARGAGGGGSVMHSSWNNLTKFQCNDNVLL